MSENQENAAPFLTGMNMKRFIHLFRTKYTQTETHLTPLLQILCSSFIHFISPTYRGHLQVRACEFRYVCPVSIGAYFTDKSSCSMWEWPLQFQWLGIDHIWPERTSPKEVTISNISILMMWWFVNLVRWKYSMKIFATAIIIELNVNERSIADNRKDKKIDKIQTLLQTENHQAVNIVLWRLSHIWPGILVMMRIVLRQAAKMQKNIPSAYSHLRTMT